MKALICGASNTPYAHGCYEYDIFCDNNYPREPPKMNLITTGNGSVRFNPNLYAWSLDLFNHRKFNVAVSDYILIAFILFLSLRCACFIFETWLIKVYFFTHYDCLCRKQHLKNLPIYLTLCLMNILMQSLSEQIDKEWT